MKLYIAGAWREQWTRARPFIAAARKMGFIITYDWTVPEKIRSTGLTKEEERSHAGSDLEGVLAADIFILLCPSEGVLTAGAWTELGAALAMTNYHQVNGTVRAATGQPTKVWVVGNYQPNIFGSLGDEFFETDERALHGLDLVVRPADVDRPRE